VPAVGGILALGTPNAALRTLCQSIRPKVNRAAKLRDSALPNVFLAVAPSRRRDVQENHAACQGTHCCGRTAVTE